MEQGMELIASFIVNNSKYNVGVDFGMKKFKLNLLFIALMFLMTFYISGCKNIYKEPTAEKPVIYLYPEKTMEVTVKLNYNGEVICTYPEYNEGWTVTAHPDGTLINQKDGKEYYYLFWEGNSNIEYDMSKGFVVKGEDTAEFLRDKLEYIGLTPKECNEFIVYWLPRMKSNPYNLISFQNEAYIENAELEITPEPDSILRVFMAYKPLKKKISVEEQILEPFQRQGFTVVEWGGAIVN